LGAGVSPELAGRRATSTPLANKVILYLGSTSLDMRGVSTAQIEGPAADEDFFPAAKERSHITAVLGAVRETAHL